jgi:hypothetical protein
MYPVRGNVDIMHFKDYLAWVSRFGSKCVLFAAGSSTKRGAVNEIQTSSCGSNTAGTWRLLKVASIHPRICAAIVLWISSNLFVFGLSTFTAWTGGTYSNYGDLCRWDCSWYSTVLDGGYNKAPDQFIWEDVANWPFHPVFPLSAYPLHYWFRVSVPKSLVIASKGALLFAIYSFLLLVGGEGESMAECLKAGSLVAFNPYLIYAHAGYAEPLYFTLSALALYLASHERWIASGVAGAFLSATRLNGFLFIIPYMIFCARRIGIRQIYKNRSLNMLLGLLLCPLGLAVYMLYLHHLTGDALAPVHIQNSRAWQKTPGNPAHTLWMAITSRQWPRFWGAMSLAALALSAWLVKLRKPELGIYLLASVMIALSGGIWGGMPRYIWWQPPLLFAIYVLLTRNRIWWVVYSAFASGMAAFMVTHWLSGSTFVI